MNGFQETFSVGLSVGEANGGAFETVPAGMIAVIEHVSVHASGTGASSADYFITSTLEDDSAFREVPIVAHVGGTGAMVGSHPLRAFANGGTQFGGVIRRSNANGEVVARFVLAGHFIPV